MSVETCNIQPSDPNWRRVTRHPALMEYRRLVVLVALANIAVFWTGLQSGRWGDSTGVTLAPLADMALANFALGILIRQQRVVNALFWLATRLPVSAPLWLRWGAGKVFHFGGLHSSATVSGTVWLAALGAGMAYNLAAELPGTSLTSLVLTLAIVALLLAMILSAIGPLRARFHNRFEIIHRFAGWSVLGLFWAHAASLAADANGAFLGSLSFWALCAITLSIISPWLTLKRVPIEVVKPSDHAVAVRFNYGDTPFAGSSNAISLNPLTEWHSFANIPAPGEDGYRLIISRAGDWTGRFIDNPPEKVWVKGITTSGVARIEVLFRKVVYVATGSGIGPVLPHLLAKDVPTHLIWSTRSPVRTYGQEIVDEILQSSPDALIWDTDASGKPDLSALAERAVKEHDAEAVIVIANQKLTRKVVHDMESQGIPAFGAIWDS